MQLIRLRATLEIDRLARQLQYLYPYTFKCPFLDGQMLDVIEHVLTRELRIDNVLIQRTRALPTY